MSNFLVVGDSQEDCYAVVKTLCAVDLTSTQYPARKRSDCLRGQPGAISSNA